MENIKNLAEKLSEKNSWVRKAAGKMVKKWGEISECGEEISSDTAIEINQEKIYLVTEKNDLQKWDGWTGEGEWKDCNTDHYFHNAFDMHDLRKFLSLFPKMVSEIEAKMEKNLKKNSELEEFFKKLK